MLIVSKNPHYNNVSLHLFEPIIPKPILIDFTKLDTNNLIGIFKPKLEATTRRLKVIFEVFIEHNVKHRQSVTVLNDRLLYALEHLADVVAKASPKELQSLDWALKSIGKVSFTSLRRNFTRILASLATIADGGYCNWMPL